MSSPVDHKDLLERLRALPNLAGLPREELGWLVEHGELQTRGVGDLVAPKGKPVENLFVILEGHIGVRVDRGSGPRRVMGWGKGEVTGMLPYSRMRAPPGDNVAEEPSVLLAIDVGHFPEMIHRCPTFTAYTVHLMLDRARSFNASDLQDEKMISLGRLAAGLAHELNNPASAAARGARLLLEGLAEADSAARALGGAGLSEEQHAKIDAVRNACYRKPMGDVLSALEQASREDDIADWLQRHGQSERHSVPLADTAVTLEDLDLLAESLSDQALDAALRWVAAGCAIYSLATDVENAATRIHELVAAVKRFTFMDSRGGPEAVDVESGLRDTVRVVAAEARAKGASISLDFEPGLPKVHASGAELNQVWLNLIDNALDAIPESGHVRVEARRDRDRVVVRVIDDGPGIPEDVLPRIWDPFFTTKPPGQGTGLGLDLTLRLIRRYGGDIGVDSRPGRTEFRISLAVEDEAPG